MMNKIYKTVLFLGIAAVMIFAPIARGAVRPWLITPVMVVLYALIFMWLIRVNNRPGAVPTPMKQPSGGSPYLLTVPVALFAMLAMTSFAFSVYKHDSFYALLRLFAYIGLYYVIVSESGHRVRKYLIWLAVFIGGCLSAYGLLQYFGVFNHAWWKPANFLAATFVNHNHFAGYLELVIPAGITLLIFRSTRYRLLLASALVFMLSVFILTQSRGAWLSLGFALLVMVVLMVKKASGNVKVMIIAALLIVAAVSLLSFSEELVSSRMDTMTNVKAGDDVSGGRFKIWQGAVAMARERPLAGFGIGDFDAAFYRYRPAGFNMRAVYAHNDYLQMAAEMGVVAPFLMLWIFILAIKEGFRKRETSPYAFGCAIGVMSLALHGVVDFNFHIPANMLLFTIWIAIITAE